MRTMNQTFDRLQVAAWDSAASQKPAGGCSQIMDYTRGRFDPTKSGVEGGIFAGCTEVPADPRAAAAAQRVKAMPTGGGYGKADFLDRLALAEQRDEEGLNQYAASEMNNGLQNDHFAGMRPSMKPSKEEQMQALTKRQTTLRAAEQRVRENQAEAMKQQVQGGLRKQWQMTPQAVAIESAEVEYEQGERVRRQRQMQAERDERMSTQIAEHQALQAEELAARRQRKAMIEARKAAEMREHQKEIERQQYVQQREQAWQPDYLQGRHASPMRAMPDGSGAPFSSQQQQQQRMVPHGQQHARGASPRRSASPRGMGVQQVAGVRRGNSPRRSAPPARGHSPRRSSSPRGGNSSVLVHAPPGGHSSIVFG